MKKISRMAAFSALSLYLTSLIIKGFVLKIELIPFITAVLILAVVYYFITPFLKLVLLPLNILTIGLTTVIAYVLIFNFVINYFGFISIKSWVFEGLKFGGINIPKMQMNYITTLISSSILYSSIINLLELTI